MGTRADELAARFEAANAEVIAAAEGGSDAWWRAATAAEGWPVGTTVHHLAESHLGVLGIVQGLAAGGPFPPVTREMLDHFNAQHAAQHAECDRGETVALLRRNGEAAARAIRELDDEALDRGSPAPLAGGRR